MKKSFFRRSLATAALVLSLCTATSAASFTDVGDEWFSTMLDQMVELEVVKGYTDGTFRPYNSVSMGELSTMLCGLTDTAPLSSTGSHWATGFVDAAYDAGWLETYPSDFDTAATRYQVAQAVFAMAGLEIDDSLENPFADMDDPYTPVLYHLGIISGSTVDGQLVYLPDSNVTRAEICAILNHVIPEDTSVPVTDPEAAPQTATYTYIPPAVEEPSTTGENTFAYYQQVLTYMMVNDVQSFSCTFKGISLSDLESQDVYTLSSQAYFVVRSAYHELGSFYESIQQAISWNGSTSTLTLTIGDPDFSIEATYSYKDIFLTQIGALATSLYADGTLTTTASDYHNALAIYRWCAHNIAYDTSFNPISYTGYGALINGTSVCQGYTAVFNALCNVAGIQSIGVSGTADGDAHIWNYVNLDGTWYHVDVTFGDPIPDRAGYCDESYFAVTLADLASSHVVDSTYATYGITF